MSQEQVNINWFPGHMQKAIRAIEEKVKTCDGVIEIGDARAPFSSLPNYLDKITKDKLKVYIYSKIDLADLSIFNHQKTILKESGIEAFSFDLRKNSDVQAILKYLSSVKSKKDERFIKLGFPIPSKRFMVLGIPNVGKSTFINSLAKKKKAAVENRPGKTRTETLIKINDRISIFDVPGVLEPNYEDKDQIMKLAILGSIKMEVLPLIPLTDYLLDHLKKYYLNNLISRYKLDYSKSDEEIFTELASTRNFYLSDSKLDIDRARISFLKEFRDGVLGRVSFDE